MFIFYKFYKYVYLGFNKFFIRCKKYCMYENILIQRYENVFVVVYFFLLIRKIFGVIEFSIVYIQDDFKFFRLKYKVGYICIGGRFYGILGVFVGR